MKNVHVIPTDKPSRLAYDFNKLILNSKLLSPTLYKTQHIYVTSDEEIKEGDWAMFENENIVKADKNFIFNCDHEFDKFWRKVILTTDPQLIADGVQPINDKFLEWFVRNPSCERVEVGNGVIRLTETDNKGYWISTPDTEFNMQIEEPKQEPTLEQIDQTNPVTRGSTALVYKEETLEEAAEKEFPLIDTEWCRTGACEEENLQLLGHRRSFITGAKWMQEQFKNESTALYIDRHIVQAMVETAKQKMYSEEEVLQLLLKLQQTEFYDNLYDWFQQNKKK